MTDDSDKTVFQQPQPGINRDRTVLKPSPGRRSPPSPRANAVPRPGANVRPAAITRPSVESDAAYFRTESGLNPLTNAASTLTAVFSKTRQSATHEDVGGFHRRLVNEIKAFDARLRELDYKNEVVLSARYITCVMLDEAVLNTPWGSNSPWAQRTMLSVFHNETSGGEKFYQILERMRQSPSENLEILEFFYIILSLGFEGKYRIANRGRDQIELLRDDLFKTIRSYRGEYERELSTSWQGLGSARRTLTDFIPMWVIGVLAVALIVFSYMGFRYWLYESATPIAERLHELSIDKDALPEKGSKSWSD